MKITTLYFLLFSVHDPGPTPTSALTPTPSSALMQLVPHFTGPTISILEITAVKSPTPTAQAPQSRTSTFLLNRRLGRVDWILNDGGHSSMVELQIVVLAVAGSSPVGRPVPPYFKLYTTPPKT